MKFSAVLYALEHGRIAEWEGENFRLREGHLETDRHGIWQTCAIPRHGATSSTWKISPAWQSGPTEPPKCGDPCFVVGCREACDKPPGTRESNHGDIHGHGPHVCRYQHGEWDPNPCQRCGEAPCRCRGPHVAPDWDGTKTPPTLPQDWPIEALREGNELRRERDEWRQKAREANSEAFVNKTLLERERDAVAALKTASNSCITEPAKCASIAPFDANLHCIFAANHLGPYHGNPWALWPKAPEPGTHPHRVKVQG